ncbi:hypothetical protein BACERE00198_03157 [Bacillus cereus]|nr:hypothetical protein BACERE00198_03157 [Bacillus cereus]
MIFLLFLTNIISIVVFFEIFMFYKCIILKYILYILYIY